MRRWLEQEKTKDRPDKRNLLKIKPVKIGNKKVRRSEEIDEFLYGSNL